MSIEIGITSGDVISYIILFAAAFIGGFIGAKMGYLSECVSQQRKIRTRDEIDKHMDEKLEKELPHIKDKIEHRDDRWDD